MSRPTEEAVIARMQGPRDLWAEAEAWANPAPSGNLARLRAETRRRILAGENGRPVSRVQEWRRARRGSRKVLLHKCGEKWRRLLGADYLRMVGYSRPNAAPPLLRFGPYAWVGDAARLEWARARAARYAAACAAESEAWRYCYGLRRETRGRVWYHRMDGALILS